MTTSLSNLAELIKARKLDEAKIVLNNIVAAPLSDRERGEALVKLAMIYIEVKNSIDRDFLESYKETMRSIKSLNAAEQDVKDQIKIKELRKKLA